MKLARIGWVGVALLSACSAPSASDELPEALDQKLDDPVSVLGFEETNFWTASAGTKSSSLDRTQGDAALGVASFTYAELLSSSLATVSGVTSRIALDFKAPVSPSWGTAQLFVSIPSRGVHNANLGSVSLMGSPAGSWRSLVFNVPTSVVTALGQSYSDLRFKITLNLPQISEPYLVDALRFVTTQNPSVVTLSASNVDDYVYVTVNGLRRKVVPINGVVSDEPISDWFVPGNNSVRIQAMNTAGPGNYAFRVVADGLIVADASCASTPCGPLPAGLGVVFDQTYQVSTPNRPAARTLTVNGTAGGKIYLNDAYTGYSVPRTFTLPQGQYVVGVGVGEGTPSAYAGQYYEQTVQLSTTNRTVTPTSGSPLSFPNQTRIAILPIRETIHGSGGPTNTGILSDDDITVMLGQTEATRDAYVEPFSYGLTTWDIDVLPTVEDVPLYRQADSGDAGDVGTFLADAGLTHLEQEYDIIMYFYSKYTASGAEVANGPCCFWAIEQSMWFPNHTTRGSNSASSPNVYLLHESLHNYESYNDWRLHFYNGAEGAHGAGVHGYPSGSGGENDFLQFYRLFMRNQVAEVNTMRAGQAWSGSPPSSADIWVGVFDTMRRDVNWQSTFTANRVAAASGPVAGVRSRPFARAFRPDVDISSGLPRIDR